MTTFIAMVLSLIFHSKCLQSFHHVVIMNKACSFMGGLPLSSCHSDAASGLSSISLASSRSDSEIENSSIPFDGSEGRFDRWRFLQDFLEGDHRSSDEVNIVLFRVLEGVLKYSQPSASGDDTVELTAKLKENIQEILENYSTDGRVNAVVALTMSDDDSDHEKTVLSLLERLEKVLPDPIESEDDYKSLWDTVIELHGREAVKINESQNPVSLHWKIANTVTRVLLHYDFLTHGILDSPL